MSTTPKDIAFDNASKNRDHNIFTEEYYGGADTFIYIDGKRYEDISSLSFSVRETVKPIYGYASRRYDDLAVGTRIVQGMIRVPVKNEGPVDRLTDTSNSGSYRMTNESGDISVPDWVYKYTPDTEALGTSNYAYQNVDVNRATVAAVQAKLAKLYDGVEVNGYVDLPTKLAVADYKKTNNLVVNTNVDLDLQNRMGMTGNQYLATAKVDCKLRYSPSDTSNTFYDIDQGDTLVIQGFVDDTWILVQVKDGKKGYIKASEKVNY
jgi:hypothetical protein